MHPDTDLQLLSEACANADSLQALAQIALLELKKFPDGAEIVCGPISTGGLGVEQNLRVFERSILALGEEGRPMFSQIPYEAGIFLMREHWWNSHPSRMGKYYWPILLRFYLPLFRSGKISAAYFIPGWEHSFGAVWERRRLMVYGIPTWDLPADWPAQMLARTA